VTLTALIAAVVALTLLYSIWQDHLRGTYVCPVCGTTRQERHADECPWDRGS
jgi:rubrerythrin